VISERVLATNPFAGVICTPLKVAVPLEIVELPSFVSPFAKTIVPLIVPAVVELTEAVSEVVEPIVGEIGVAETVVVVVARFDSLVIAVSSAPASIDPNPVTRS
jgi:hypothetical protein